MKFLHILTILTIIVYTVNSAKILVFYHIPAISHYTLGSTLAIELANRGHEVTFISPYPQKEPIKNLREISLESLVPAAEENKKDIYKMDGKSFFDLVTFMTTFGVKGTKDALKHKNVQALLDSREKFDLIIMMQYMNEAFLGLAHKFNAPIITVTSMPAFSWASHLLAHPAPSSYVPNLLGKFSSHMNFWERSWNTIYDLYSILYYNWKIMPQQRELAKKYIPGSPLIDRHISNVSLVLLNSHPSIYDATPQVPNAIEIGGFHVKQPKPLPKDLQQFLDNSKHGAIIFALGSNLKMSEMCPCKKKALFNTFSKLKQNVIWKWENEEYPGTSPNIKYYKWLPQSDILAHPNVKAFITHGGLLSTIESIYHGVPIIGMPLVCDQKMNMAHALKHGYGIPLPLGELSEETLTKAINKILANSQYAKNMKIRSEILKDQPLKPLDNAIYWIEYVIRHKGAPHLKYAGMELNWFQRNMWDIGLIALILTSIVFASLKYVIKKTFHCHCPCKTQDKSKNKNKKE